MRTRRFQSWGIITSRRFGNAVNRNKAKRLIREIFRKNIKSFPMGSKSVFIPKPKMLLNSFKSTEQEVGFRQFQIPFQNNENIRSNQYAYSCILSFISGKATTGILSEVVLQSREPTHSLSNLEQNKTQPLIDNTLRRTKSFNRPAIFI